MTFWFLVYFCLFLYLSLALHFGTFFKPQGFSSHFFSSQSLNNLPVFGIFEETAFSFCIPIFKSFFSVLLLRCNFLNCKTIYRSASFIKFAPLCFTSHFISCQLCARRALWQVIDACDFITTPLEGRSSSPVSICYLYLRSLRHRDHLESWVSQLIW